MRGVWACIGGLALVVVAGCGSDDDSAAGGGAAAGAGGGAAALTLTCNTAGYVAGSVDKPTAAQVSAYAATYNGDEGSYDMAGTFAKSGAATLVVANDGALTYKGVSYTPSSVCIDKVAGTYGKVMYFVAGKGHVDVSDKVDTVLGQAWGVSLADGTTVFTNARK